ncbi:MAG: hypothetical protein JJU05_19380 [Verrucomicrobia bacterium]|nr:hypothetical protein [Verrucomicrobiota bacterium]
MYKCNLWIHPFRESILRQYENRINLFADPEVLPAFESLQVIPAVQSMGGRHPNFPDWFAALEWMKEQMNRADFDVALIGCGAYGLSLATHAKSLGKTGIHIGGALQLLFGIKGSRWEGSTYQYDKRFYNSHWIRPIESETPAKADSFKNKCYW